VAPLSPLCDASSLGNETVADSISASRLLLFSAGRLHHSLDVTFSSVDDCFKSASRTSVDVQNDCIFFLYRKTEKNRYEPDLTLVLFSFELGRRLSCCCYRWCHLFPALGRYG
jgi:hypothetical protein